MGFCTWRSVHTRSVCSLQEGVRKTSLDGTDTSWMTSKSDKIYCIFRSSAASPSQWNRSRALPRNRFTSRHGIGNPLPKNVCPFWKREVWTCAPSQCFKPLAAKGPTGCWGKGLVVFLENEGDVVSWKPVELGSLSHYLHDFSTIQTAGLFGISSIRCMKDTSMLRWELQRGELFLRIFSSPAVIWDD